MEATQRVVVQENLTIDLLTAKSGEPTVRINGTYTHSSYSPEKEATSWAKAQVAAKEDDALEESLWVLLGCGLGYHIRALLDQGVARVIAFEPDERLASLRKKVAPELDTLEKVTITGSRDELRDLFRSRFPSASGTRICIIPAYEKIYQDLLDDVREQLSGFVQEFRVSRFTYISASKSWLMLTIGNIPVMIRQPAVGVVAGRAKGWPAVVVSAGPSLDKNIDQLAAVQDQFVILCPSQTLKAAHKAGIRPDMVMVADSHNLCYHFEGLPDGAFDNLVIAAKCHYDVARIRAKRNLFYYLPPNPMAEEFYRLRQDGMRADLPTGASVANIAMQLGVIMDADPIIMIGQDLAFSGNRMYASGAADGGGRLDYLAGQDQVSLKGFETKRQIADDTNRDKVLRNLTAYREVQWVRGQTGELLPTSVDMRSMLAKFERDAAEINTERRLINATEGGAFIRGMEHMTFAQVVEKFGGKSVCMESRIDQAARINPEKVKRVLKGLSKMQQSLFDLEKAAKRCLRLSARVLKSNQDDISLLQSLSGAEKKLYRLLADHQSINSMVQEDLVRFRSMGDPKEDDLVKNTQRARVLYQAVEAACAELRQALREACQKGAKE